MLSSRKGLCACQAYLSEAGFTMLELIDSPQNASGFDHLIDFQSYAETPLGMDAVITSFARNSKFNDIGLDRFVSDTSFKNQYCKNRLY